jgi:hypothetical protein
MIDRLVKCKVCDAQVSSASRVCPSCGHKKAGCILKGILFFTAIMIFGMIVSTIVNVNNKHSQLGVEMRLGEPPIKYEATREWNIGNFGKGLELLVPENTKTEDAKKLLEYLKSKYRNFSVLTIAMIDEREAAINYMNPDYPDEKVDKHTVLHYLKNEDNNLDMITVERQQ